MMNSLHHEKERIKNNFLRRHVHINFEVDVLISELIDFYFFYLILIQNYISNEIIQILFHEIFKACI